MSKKKLKILMPTEYFYPHDKGGAEWSSFYLAQSLAAKGHQVEIFTPNYGSKTNALKKSVSIYRFPFYKKITPAQVLSPIFHTNALWWLISTYYLFKKAKKTKPDLIHVQGKYFLPAAVVVGKILHIPILVTLRDYILLCPYALCISRHRQFRACNFIELISHDMRLYINSYLKSTNIFSFVFVFLSGIHGWLVSRLLQFSLRFADQVVVISQQMAKIYRYNHIKVTGVIYNSFDFPTASKLPKTSKLPKNSLVYVGRLTPGKGVKLLVDAFCQLKKDTKLPQLVLIGEGILKGYRQSDSIIYSGRLNHHQTLKTLSRSLLAVVPSVWEEPFGRVALEALAVGTPVLTTARGGLPEIVKDQVTGVVVKPRPNSLLKGIKLSLEKNQFLRNQIRQQKKNLQRKFGSQTISQYLKLYSQLVS